MYHIKEILCTHGGFMHAEAESSRAADSSTEQAIQADFQLETARWKRQLAVEI